MNDDDDSLSPETIRRIEDALLSSPAPGLDPAFRASLRARFASGEIAAAVPAEAAAPSRPADSAAGPGEAATMEWLPEAASRRPVPSRARRALWLVPAMAAAVVLGVLLLRPQPAPLRVTATGPGSVRVGDRTLPLDDAAAIAAELRPGTAIGVEGPMGAELRFDVDDDYTLQAVAGAELTVPLPARSGRLSFRLSRGEVRVTTRPGLAGEAIEIGAPGTRVDVLGTTLAVIADEASTCVCLLDGRALMRTKNGEMATLEPGMRRVQYMDPGRADEVAPIVGDERMKLEMLRDSVGGVR